MIGRIPDADVLDIFAGTGNLGIEALSRGANSAVFVDKSPECIQTIKENLHHTKLSERAAVLTADAGSALEGFGKGGKKFDIVFADPPYHKNILPEILVALVRNDIIKENGIVIAERDESDTVPQEVESLKRFRDQKYGDTVLSFYILEAEHK